MERTQGVPRTAARGVESALRRERVGEAVPDRRRRAAAIHQIALLHLAGDEGVGEKVVPAAPERRLDVSRRRAPAEPVGADPGDLALVGERIVAETEIVDVRVEPE